ncbi:MAG TPA: ABC transporter ATP-binding protein [Acidimicrobiia bacterium]|nr:ABC transporter ATP-binding protein [Acidimicrobiia bacterium]
MVSSTNAVTVEGLVKHYKKTKALDGLDFSIPSGAITGFLGPNGAGKTTTFRALLGLTHPNAGHIEILGHQVPAQLQAVTKKVGAIIEEPGLIRALGGRVNLQVAADTLGFGHQRIDELLDFVELTVDAGRRVEEYSKGMRQRLALAAALLGEPELLLLDEPLDGLDPAGQRGFRERLRQLADDGRTVVVSSHDLSDIEALADYIIVINHGRLVAQGTLDELLGDGSGIRVVVADATAAVAALAAEGIEASVESNVLTVQDENGSRIIEVLARSGIYPSEVGRARSSLEAVFLGMTIVET